MPEIPQEHRVCPECGEDKIAFKDGKSILLRCSCDWKRGFFGRVKRTIHPEYWHKTPKTICDWKPGLFGPKSGRARPLMQMQKTLVIKRLHGFCFKETGKTEEGYRSYAMDDSLAQGRNLFIRGPSNSGRGLLLASLKVFLAMRDISVTPLPGDFSVFKSDMVEASSYGKEGDSARITVAESYQNVSVLMLEGVHGEFKNNYSGEKVASRSRAADAIDNLIAKRVVRQGSVVCTSSDFMGEIGETLGDKFSEVMNSARTIPVLMFHPREGLDLLAALNRRCEFFSKKIDQYFDVAKQKGGSKKTVEEGLIDKQELEFIKEGLHFDEVFEDIPSLGEGGEPRMTAKLENMLRRKGCPESIKSLYECFSSDKQLNGASFQEDRMNAQMNAVRECKGLASKMTQREVYETSKLLAITAEGEEKRQARIKEAQALMREMAGLSDG